MRATNLLRLQPGRALQAQSSRTLQMRSSSLLRTQTTPMLRMHLQASSIRMFYRSAPMMKEIPKEEHSAHTISQRLRSIKKMPVELVPLVLVMAVAIFAAVFSMGRKLYTDKQLRLSRQGNIKIPKNQQKPSKQE